MRFRGFVLMIGLVALGVFTLGGCTRARLDRIVKADTDANYRSWQSEMVRRFSKEDWRVFDEALAEIKAGIVSRREASGSTTPEAVLRERVHGRTVREILLLGYGERVARLTAEGDALRVEIQQNRQLRGRVDDPELVRRLDEQSEAQSARLQKIGTEVVEAEKVILQARSTGKR